MDHVLSLSYDDGCSLMSDTQAQAASDCLLPTAYCLLSLADAVQGCRRCQAAGHLERAAPRLLGLASWLAPGRAAPPRPRLLVVGQAPSRHAARYAAEPLGSPFVRAIAGWMARAGFPSEAVREQVHFSALTRCFPGPGADGRGDRAPSRAEIALCADHLQAEIAVFRPAIILAVGKLAVDTLAGRVRPLSAAIGDGWERDGIRYLALPHPSGVSRWHNEPANRARLDRALARLAAWRAELDL